MYRYERALADEHVADMRRTADRFRLAKLAQCCTAVVKWFDSIRCRIRRRRDAQCDI
ncbi:MAG TPA: hypothetical protein VFJ09_05630 [Nocardioidaceae bacterium]|jgi:hypothetical protein|nr:hypothetical protein [Nocardioidaceae bacterium]